jgi:hypothetical protein
MKAELRGKPGEARNKTTDAVNQLRGKPGEALQRKTEEHYDMAPF